MLKSERVEYCKAAMGNIKRIYDDAVLFAEDYRDHVAGHVSDEYMTMAALDFLTLNRRGIADAFPWLHPLDEDIIAALYSFAKDCDED